MIFTITTRVSRRNVITPAVSATIWWENKWESGAVVSKGGLIVISDQELDAHIKIITITIKTELARGLVFIISFEARLVM